MHQRKPKHAVWQASKLRNYHGRHTSRRSQAKNYLFVEKIEVEINYTGELCAFSESPVIVKGTAGGIVENSTQTADIQQNNIQSHRRQYSRSAPPKSNGTAYFPTEPFESHREQTLEVA